MSKALKGHARVTYWQSKIAAWHSSGQSQQAFCRSRELNYAQFVYWRRKLDGDALPIPAQSAKPSSGFVSVMPPVASAVEPATELSLILPNGVELRGIAMGNVDVALRLLSRLS